MTNNQQLRIGEQPTAFRSSGEGTRYTIGEGVARAALVQPYQLQPGDPPTRPLQIYTLDPAASRQDGSVATVQTPYEPLAPGPKGALIVVDCHDQDRRHAATPINLDDPAILIQNGRKPSSTDYGFHQQMVYAVCMLTYTAFRRALGRDIAWGFNQLDLQSKQPRLRVFPYGFAGENAHYDKQRGELRFGYYQAHKLVKGRNLPNGRVYTSLSHDIIAHEMTHALLDGLRSRFALPTGRDVPAFHEGFADLIAIFQRFSYEQVVQSAVRQAYRRWGDELDLLTSIARQFGETTTEGGRLRTAINMETVMRKPKLYHESKEAAHELGSILVAAVLNAAVTLFLKKTERYVRLATNGTGVLPKGELSHDLHNLLTDTARKLASQFLTICVRAVDYCPPVDITFGDFLRAVITADHDLVPDDPWGYREAWIDAFRLRCIYPSDIKDLSEEALLWDRLERPIPAIEALSFAQLRFKGDPGRPATTQELHRQACALGEVVSQPQWIEEFGCVYGDDPRLRGDTVDLPRIESIRTSQRAGPNGEIVYDLVAEVLQRRRVQKTQTQPAFDFYGGATVILNPEGRIRYLIRKRIVSETRLSQQRKYMQSDSGQKYWAVQDGIWRLQDVH